MERIGILGCGTMGQAILAGLNSSAEPPHVIAVTTRHSPRAEHLGVVHGVVAGTDNALLADTDAVVLAVKPQAARAALTSPAAAAAIEGKLVISICAGVTTSQLAVMTETANSLARIAITPCACHARSGGPSREWLKSQ